ncbi:glycosyl hydrolase family 18 protein [Psychromonas hadalis]|uniref:glycosyl hydrolase family 18 protein n=1 Tax=Psychromonas hadalis TaxID=211669 RepID=UPI00146BD0C2|nr:glycosyl hydrolase family 18 protein [Psychromonas hadalis]
MPSIYKSLPLLLLFVLSGCDDNQFTDVIGDHWIKEPEVCLEDTTPVTFKKVAYWSPDNDDPDASSDNLELVHFSSLTHVNYASITFNADATLNTPEDIDPLEDLVLLAHTQSVKVAISLGNADDTIFNSIASDKTLTKTFVNNIVNFIEEYALDGIDINWSTIDSDSESDRLKYLLKKLSDELKEQGKFLSMTAPSGEDEKLANKLSTENFQYVDFINLLAFDSTNNDSLHSSMQDAKDAITYWTQRCVIKNKLVLGVPFYSRGSAVQSYDYLIRDDIRYACVDKSERRDYNGIPTVVEKTNYALLKAGGVMMKSLEQDVYIRHNDDVDFSEYSLLNVINETALGNQVTVCQ